MMMDMNAHSKMLKADKKMETYNGNDCVEMERLQKVWLKNAKLCINEKGYCGPLMEKSSPEKVAAFQSAVDQHKSLLKFFKKWPKAVGHFDIELVTFQIERREAMLAHLIELNR